LIAVLGGITKDYTTTFGMKVGSNSKTPNGNVNVSIVTAILVSSSDKCLQTVEI
jgi:hypothetical protein